VKLQKHSNNLVGKSRNFLKNGQDLRSRVRTGTLIIYGLQKGADFKLIFNMKKIFVILVALIGFGFSANAQSATVDDARFTGINSSNLTATIQVTVAPTFTPSEKGNYVFTVSASRIPGVTLRQSIQSITNYWDGSKWVNPTWRVNFDCNLQDASISQCSSHSFSVSARKQ